MKKSVIAAAIVLLVGCSSVKLPPVKGLPNGFYFVPGCGLYDDPKDRPWITFPTAQEAELSGYRAAGACREAAAARIRQEIDVYGKMSPTNETEKEKARTIRARETDRQLQDLEDKQRELDKKQNELEEQKVDKKEY